MGYFGRIKDKLRAQELRKQGLSYREILLQIHVSKDTISRWCKDIILTEDQKLRLLNNKKFGQRKGSMIAAENKRNRRLQQIERNKLKGKKDLGKLKQRDRFIAGISLYAAEGNKSDGKAGFANSDPKIIKFMMEWFQEFCNLPLEKFRGSIWIHDNLSERKAIKFWSKLTGIPYKQFHKTYIAKNKIDSKKIRKNIHEFGVFAIKFSDANIHRMIMGWIYALFDDKMAIHSAVAQW